MLRMWGKVADKSWIGLPYKGKSLPLVFNWESQFGLRLGKELIRRSITASTTVNGAIVVTYLFRSELFSTSFSVYR